MKKILLSTFLLLGFCVQAQETSNQFSLNFLMPSVEYETAISKNSTIDAMLGFGFRYHDASYLDKAEYGIYPDFQLQYRHYYNLIRDWKKAKGSQKIVGIILRFQRMFQVESLLLEICSLIMTIADL